MVTASSKKTRRSARPNGDGEKKRKQYQVEAILDKRTRGRKTEYLLKWKGYSNADNSWEDESHLNCPDLVKEFERKQMGKTKKRPSSTPPPSPRARKVNKKTPTRQVKVSGMEETDDEYQSEEDSESQTTEAPTESTMTDTVEDDDRILTRHSQRKKPAPVPVSKTRSPDVSQRKSTRTVVDQTKSRITSMSREESSEGDDDDSSIQESPARRRSPRKTTTSPKASKAVNETPIILIDDDNNDSRVSQRNTNRQNGSSNDSTTTSTSERRPYVSASSISFGPNASNQTNGSTTVNTDEEEIPNESYLVEKIESVRNDLDGLTFYIQLVDENEPRWISSKIANLRYPQAVIAFWESHVEFA